MTTTPAELIAEGKRLRINLVLNEGSDDESTLYAFASWAVDTAECLAAALEAAQGARSGDYVLVPCEPTGEMIAAALCALTEWRNSLSPDEAILRRSAPVQSGRVFLASATPEEKAAIRYRAMISVATPADGGK